MTVVTDLFIPEKLAAEGGLERRRAEIAIKTVFVLLIGGTGCTLFVHWLLGSFLITGAITAGLLVVASAPLVLRQTGRMDLTSLFILFPLYAVFTGYAFKTGGLTAPGVSYLLILPLLALIFRGLSTAAVWIGVALITWIGFFFAGHLGSVPPVDSTEQDFLARRMSELVTLSFTVFGLFYFRDELKNWLVDTVQQRQAETRAVLETAPDGILTLDLDGTVTEANDAAARIFGRELDALIGADIDELVASLSPADLTDDLEELTEFGHTREYTGDRRGQSVPLEVAFGLIEDNEQRRIILIVRDITNRKAVERQLRHARDEALEASRAKSTFLAKMSHELRTPLNAVIGYSDLLIEELEDSEPDGETTSSMANLDDDLRHIRSAGKHLLELINDILDLSKIEADQMHIEVTTVDVASLVEEVVDTLGPMARENDNDIELDIDDAVQPMESDATKIRQILFNLTSNACKFTEGGIIRIGAEHSPEADNIVLTVEDTGIGMTEQQLDSVFDAFRQADDSTTREFGGTGLGLTITRHFCDMLGGEIDVTSTPKEGTTFRVELPRRIDDTDQPVEPS